MDVLIQADLLMNDLALRVENCDDIGVRKLAVRIFFEAQAEQRRQLQHVVRAAAHQGPAFRRQIPGLPVFGQRRGCVPLGVEGNEGETDSTGYVRWQRRLDAFHIADNNRAGKLAMGEKHGDDLRPASESAQLDLRPLVRHPGGFSLVNGFIGERGRHFGLRATRRLGGTRRRFSRAARQREDCE